MLMLLEQGRKRSIFFTFVIGRFMPSLFSLSKVKKKTFLQTLKMLKCQMDTWVTSQGVLPQILME